MSDGTGSEQSEETRTQWLISCNGIGEWHTAIADASAELLKG